MTILNGKKVLVTGVARTDSIAFAVADRAQRLGADVALAVFPRDLESATEAARQLTRPPVCTIAADVTITEDLSALEQRLRDEVGHVDAALHAVAFAPAAALAGIVGVPSETVEMAFRTSTHSYAGLAATLSNLAPAGGASLVGLDFENSQAWPVYNWMGPCKAALRSLNQYLARDLGPRHIRSNLVAAGPLNTRAASGIPDFDQLLRTWATRSPIPWDPHDPGPVADAVCFLFSDLSRAVTGEVLHADGGVHAIADGFIATESTGT
ncbi:MAG: enoyl ACP reductase [Candidatus Poriferisodalaceae bacterium]|jgi:enoyl ACP reductase